MKVRQSSTSWMMLSRVLMVLATLIVFHSCSTTRNLPEDERLYMGIEQIELVNDSSLQADRLVLDNVKDVLAYPPNNALFGSSSLRLPLPIGLWVYNAFVNSHNRIGKWVFKKFSSKPVLISTVNPSLRTQAAESMLRDDGFFRARVTSKVVPQRNPRKEKISYVVNAGNRFVYDSIEYLGFTGYQDTLIRRQMNHSLLSVGSPFSLPGLENERKRLTSLFRDNGFYDYQEEYVTFLADTVRNQGKVWLQIRPQSEIPPQAGRRWYVGETLVNLRSGNRSPMEDSLQMPHLKICYSGKRPPLRPQVLLRNLRLSFGEVSSEEKRIQSRNNLIRTGLFSSVDVRMMPESADTLSVSVNAVLAKPLDVDLEAKLVNKSNGMAGPGITLGVYRKNLFRSAETLSIKMDLSYEWQLGGSDSHGSRALDSWELGISASLDFPTLIFPGAGKYSRFPGRTEFKLYAGRLNRAGFYRVLSFGGSAVYTIQPTRMSKHVFTPFRLSYHMLQEHTHTFDSIMQQNPALAISFQNQFIPAMNYSYTFDDASLAFRRHHTWWNISLTSAGGVVSAVYALFGKPFDERDKSLFGNPFAQFIKVTSELRNLFKIQGRTVLATRLFAGIVLPYGNSRFTPYSEQFYVGGANSLRAFSARSIGPGSFHPSDGKYAYLDETGDVRLEANAELRFPLWGKFYGAVFIDAGNVWLLCPDEKRRGGVLTWKDFGKDIALCTGAGVRYDLDFLILRLDMGVALHMPYDTGKGGYYNIPSFKDGLGLHIAVGYPF